MAQLRRLSPALPAALVFVFVFSLSTSRAQAPAGTPAWLPAAVHQLEVGPALDGGPNDSPPPPEGAFPDAVFNVPWEGVVWATMPSFTWAACDVSAQTRQAIDIAIGQWRYAAANQGLPIQLSEVSCDANPQIAIIDSATDDAAATLLDSGALGATQVSDATDQPCDVSSGDVCIADHALIALFPENWARFGLTFAQAAKTVAHEIGHAVGLGHAHVCNFETVMPQSCEPILRGLGPDDVQSLDALVDFDRAYFQQAPLRAQARDTVPAGTGQVTYHAGWNLVAGPRGTSFGAATGPLYALVAGDTSYRSIPPASASVGGFGYWAYFPRDTTVRLSGAGEPFYTATAPPGQWFLVGNDSGRAPMHIFGAVAALGYDPQSGTYVQIDTLQPGQAAWVLPDSQGEVGVGLASLTPDEVNCYVNLGAPGSC